MSYDELLEAEEEAWAQFIKLNDADPNSAEAHLASKDWNRLFDHLQYFESYREAL